MQTFDVYEDVATRTNGEIFIGVVGPVRTGKSTFIKRFMEELVLPSVEGEKKKRFRDELPQSAAGKTVMTTEPKFVPEAGAEVKLRAAVATVRLIDCVGFPVEGAGGFSEEGAPRLVKTPWDPSPMPFERAAEEGTRRVMHDHATIAVLVTTDGTIADLPRAAYEEAEARACEELKSAGKPFIILLNSRTPETCGDLAAELTEKYCVPVVAENCETIDAARISDVLERILYEFPVVSIDVELPDWVRVLDAEAPLVAEAIEGIRGVAPKIVKMSDCALLDTLYAESARWKPPVSLELHAATGKAVVTLAPKEGALFEALSGLAEEPLQDETALMRYVSDLAAAKKLYARVGQAFSDAQEYGYGIVSPDPGEMSLTEPRLVKKSGRVGVDLHADAPSYHIIRVDVSGEVRPALGTEEQSAAFVKTLSEDMAAEPDRAWNTNMFGKTLREMLGEELTLKNRSMRENVQKKMRRTVTRIVNEGKGGVICILL